MLWPLSEFHFSERKNNVAEFLHNMRGVFLGQHVTWTDVLEQIPISIEINVKNLSIWPRKVLSITSMAKILDFISVMI